ncbi:cytochrome P450 CYP72A219-like isoform X1 [Neltuma alba]|uniref:cytochrome P450 CYP72A219-like isoform X1 n=1 Tax=Neltuma alba TaxID=207710 RepID=UPI0010A3D8E7|nr:cytochrome P450 CYP72A219-like isoform X1 [Prosopis alba]
MEALEIPSLRVANSLIAGIVIFVIVGVIGRVVNWLWLRPKRLERYLRRQNLKGNPYRLGFGDLKEMSQMIQEAKSKPINLDDEIIPRVIPFRHQLIQNYGKNSFMWFGPTPMVTIANPEDIKEVFSNISVFEKVPSNPLSKFLITGLVDYNGEKWAKHRRIINPAFHVEKLKLMLPAFCESCDDMIKKWMRLVNENERGYYEIDVWPFFQTMTSDVISRTAFGSSYEEGQQIFKLQAEQVLLTLQVLRSVYIPGWRFVPTKLNRRLKEIEKEIQASVRGIIQKREKARETGQAPSDDLLDMLLESNHREIRHNGDNKNMGMSIEEVIKECKLFYFAGQETTSVLLNWTIVLLCKYPNWQSKAREEVFQVFGSQTPDYDGINRLKVVSMILYEVLRLYPPGPVATRVVSKDAKLGNLSLQAGTRVAIPIILIQQDSELWGEDAKEFNPQRFSEGISKATKSQCSYIPFAWGPRICPGQNFTLLEAKMALSLILQNFSLEFSPSYTHAPISVLTLRPQHGTHIILRKL